MRKGLRLFREKMRGLRLGFSTNRAPLTFDVDIKIPAAYIGHNHLRYSTILVSTHNINISPNIAEKSGYCSWTPPPTPTPAEQFWILARPPPLTPRDEISRKGKPLAPIYLHYLILDPRSRIKSVSYTHLTLPTICSV